MKKMRNDFIAKNSYRLIQYNIQLLVNNVTNSARLQHFEEINEIMKNYSRDFQGFF